MPSREMSINIGLPVAPATIKDFDTYQELYRIYNALRNIVYGYDEIFGLTSPAGGDYSQTDLSRCNIGGFARIYKTASVDIGYGQTVRLVDAGGGIANAALGTSGTTCGICATVGGVLAGEPCEILMLGLSPKFAPGLLVPGNTYYQSATAGSIATAGTQALGKAVSDQQLFFNPAY